MKTCLLCLALGLFWALLPLPLPASAAEPLGPPPGFDPKNSQRDLGNADLPEWGVLVCAPFRSAGYLADPLLCHLQDDHPDPLEARSAWASLKHLYSLGWRLVTVMPEVSSNSPSYISTSPHYFLEKPKP